MSAEAYPHQPGCKTEHPETSREAAESLGDRARLIREQVLQVLTVFPDVTPDEAALFLKLDKLAVRPRFSELAKLGKIEDSGARRKNASGKNAACWRLVRKLGQLTLL